MTTRALFGLLLMAASSAWADVHIAGVNVDVKREGSLYAFTASIDTPLTKCAAYHYLTDYEAAKELPGVIESFAFREAPNKVRVERTTNEQVLFLHVRLRSVMEYTEHPFDSLAFTQVSGDSKILRGNWEIEPKAHGSTLKFQGVWEPDTAIPLFIIDHFAKNGLVDRFGAIASLAEKRKDMLSNICETPRLAGAAIRMHD